VSNRTILMDCVGCAPVGTHRHLWAPPSSQVFSITNCLIENSASTPEQRTR